jgi:glycerophosphoryl diester phosphodiesterase
VAQQIRLRLAVLSSMLVALGSAVVALTPPSHAADADPDTTCAFAAHRGYKANAIENSLRAFKAAVAQHANYLEMDVQATKDRRFALMHDETIDRTTNGTGRIINKTWDQLQQSRLNDGQRIPSLGQVLRLAEPTQSNVLIELKWIPNDRFKQIHDLITWFGTSRVVVNSFSPYVVKHFHDAYPDVSTALDVNKQISVSSARSYGGVMPDYRHSSDTWLAQLRSAGVPVYLWTLDSASTWEHYRGKVTLVLTNRDADYDAWRQTHC